MPSLILTRFRQGKRTLPFPETEPVLPERFRGLPILDQSRCPSGCTSCADACPTDAITSGEGLQIDLGRCLFCPECANACPEGAIRFTSAISTRNQQSRRFGLDRRRNAATGESPWLSRSIEILGRSLKLRQVSAGGCNGCEADVNVLNTVVFDLGRFGIQFVASPTPRGWTSDYRRHHSEHASGSRENLPGSARPENRDRGRRLCDLRRSISRSS